MKKTVLMLAAFALVFGASVACFGPGSKKDPNSPLNQSTNSVSTGSSYP